MLGLTEKEILGSCVILSLSALQATVPELTSHHLCLLHSFHLLVSRSASA